MLSFQRQVYYWAASLSAVCLFRLLQHFTISSAFFFTYGIPIIAVVMLLSDSMHNEPRAKPGLERKLSFYVATVFCLVGLGHASQVCDSAWFKALEEERVARQNLIHALMGFMSVAELEYWTNDQSPALYVVKHSNILDPDTDSSIDRLVNDVSQDSSDTQESRGARIKCHLLRHTSKLAIWLFMNHGMAGLLRLVWFGNIGSAWGFIYPFPYIANLTTNDLSLNKMVFLQALLLAPLRLAAETAITSMDQYVHTLIQRRKAASLEKERVDVDELDPNMEIIEGINPETMEVTEGVDPDTFIGALLALRRV